MAVALVGSCQSNYLRFQTEKKTGKARIDLLGFAFVLKTYLFIFFIFGENMMFFYFFFFCGGADPLFIFSRNKSNKLWISL